MRRIATFTVATLVSAAAIIANANDVGRLRDLVRRGNIAYEFSQPGLIRQCADSASHILLAGGFDEDTFVDFSASVDKLIGNYHYENSELDSARFFYDRAQNIIDTHPDTSFEGLTQFHLWRDRAQLLYRESDYAEAARLLSRADSVAEERLEEGCDTWLNVRMSYAMCLARLKEFRKALDIAQAALAAAGDRGSVEYGKANRMHAKIQLLADADKKGALKAYKAYFDIQKKYAMENFASMNSRQRDEYWQTLRPFIADCYLLEDAAPDFLYDVTLFSKGLLLQISRLSGDGSATSAALKSLSYRWTDIRRRLKSGQAAIEFIQYEKAGRQEMAALVLKPSGSPRFVPLPSPSAVAEGFVDVMNSTARYDKDKLYGDSALQHFVWTDMLLKEMDGAQRVYFAPDGYLHRLAIEYMPQVDNLEMYRLTSTRRLMEEPAANLGGCPMLLCGGVNYQLDSNPGRAADNDSLAYSNYQGSTFSRLSDSSNEARSIYEMRGCDKDVYLSSSESSEFTFRSMAQNFPSILVSTHGHFLSKIPASTDIKPAADEDVLSQNIFAMAGVNGYLGNPDFDQTSNCDGILSARELSDMNLSGCRLFTVSACQSALGEISSDGVFGIQRGLKNAGVEAMLLSLWSVESEATAFLMNEFYRRVSDGMPIAAAFREARKQMLSPSSVPNAEVKVRRFIPAVMASREVAAPAAKYDSPQYANAFILIDALD